MFEFVIKPTFSITQLSIRKNEIMVWGFRSETHILNCLREIRKCLLLEQKKKKKVRDIKHPFPVTKFCINKKTSEHGEIINKQYNYGVS